MKNKTKYNNAKIRKQKFMYRQGNLTFLAKVVQIIFLYKPAYFSFTPKFQYKFIQIEVKKRNRTLDNF